MKKLVTKKFSLKDCKIFSKNSGDLNELHLNENIREVSQFDKPVVQGILILEFLLKNKFLKKFIVKATSINVIFKKPVFINETINFNLIQRKNELIIIGLNSYQEKIIINIEQQNNKKKLIDKKMTIDKLTLKLSMISKKVGNFKKNLNLISNILINNVLSNKSNIKKFSDNFYKYISSDKKITIDTFFLSYKKKFNENFKLNSKLNINKKNFNNKKIIIIGGSSGLGRVLTIFFLSHKIKVDFTYNKNLKSAKNIQKKFKIPNERFFQFNEKKIGFHQNRLLNYEYIYFFPTPKIFNISDKYFDYERFKKFNSINLQFMLKIITLLSKSRKKHLIYIPSSKLISNFEDNIEYNSSKFIQETILKKINKTFKNIEIKNPRLDSFLTKSTKALLNNKISYDSFLKSAIDL